MIVGDLGRAAALLSIPIVYAISPTALTIWQLYAVGFIAGTLTVFFDVSNQSYLPSIVDRDELIEGNSKLQISQSAAQIAGPGLAGILIQIVQAPFAILLDAVSFVWSAFFVFLIRKPEPPVLHPADATGEKRPSIASDVRDGLRFVLGHPALRAISAGTATSNLFGNIGGGIMILYLLDSRYLNLTPGEVGVAFAIGNVGALVGAFLANRVARWFGLGPTIVGSLFIGGFMMLLVAIAPPGTAALPFLVAGVGFGGLTQMIYNINQVSYRQAICPPRMQGRMNATVRFLVWGTIPIGNVLGGVIATTFGVHEAIWLAAVLGFVPAIFPLLSPVRKLRVMPSPVDDEPLAAAPA
jgi:MFS family permease